MRCRITRIYPHARIEGGQERGGGAETGSEKQRWGRDGAERHAQREAGTQRQTNSEDRAKRGRQTNRDKTERGHVCFKVFRKYRLRR